MSKAQNLIIVELILATLFFGCLAPLPYGYFILVRFSATVGRRYYAGYRGTAPAPALSLLVTLVLTWLECRSLKPFFSSRIFKDTAEPDYHQQKAPQLVLG